MDKIGRIPIGLRRFYHPASFFLVAVATATASSSRLAGLIKSLATRLEDIVEMGPSNYPQFDLLQAIL